jgi:hypothetical protein
MRSPKRGLIKTPFTMILSNIKTKDKIDLIKMKKLKEVIYFNLRIN